MIQLPENIIDMIRKDATEISVYQAMVKEANEKRDKLWKSIKVSRAGEEYLPPPYCLNSVPVLITYQTTDEIIIRVINRSFMW